MSGIVPRKEGVSLVFGTKPVFGKEMVAEGAVGNTPGDAMKLCGVVWLPIVEKPDVPPMFVLRLLTRCFFTSFLL